MIPPSDQAQGVVRLGWFDRGVGNPSCTYSGAENTSQKALNSAQNLENKGLEIFLPPRSMILKVVRSKILETLELSCGSTAFAFTGIGRLQRLERAGG